MRVWNLLLSGDPLHSGRGDGFKQASSSDNAGDNYSSRHRWRLQAIESAAVKVKFPPIFSERR
jgi:hypothetical protein